MKNILLGFLSVIITVLPLAAAEGNEDAKETISLEILVIDAITEEPIPAAKIILDQKDSETYTDFDGFVRINEVSKVTHDIEISFISYQKQHIKAFVPDHTNNRILIKLQP